MTSSPEKGIRVAHLLPSFGAGGMEEVVATLVRNMSPRFSHTIVCHTVSGVTARLLPPGTEVLELKKPPGNSLVFLQKLKCTLKTLRPDLLNTYNWSGMDGILAAIPAGIRCLVQHEHGWGSDDPYGKSLKRRWVRRFLSHWVCEFVCVSGQLKRWLKKDVRVFPPVHQIYNGVDTRIFGPGPEGEAIRSELGIEKEEFVVGIVARLDPIKNHELLFKAFSLLRAHHKDASLLVVGDGPERRRLEAAVGEGIRMLGERTDVARLFRAMDLFVLPSHNEGISLTVLEAMTTGLPVAASRVGGNIELVEDHATGTLFDPQDPQVLAFILEGYLKNPVLRRQHGEAGMERVRALFSLEKMVERYEELYDRVLDGRSL